MNAVQLLHSSQTSNSDKCPSKIRLVIYSQLCFVWSSPVNQLFRPEAHTIAEFTKPNTKSTKFRLRANICQGVQKTYGCGDAYGSMIIDLCETAETLNSLLDGSRLPSSTVLLRSTLPQPLSAKLGLWSAPYVSGNSRPSCVARRMRRSGLGRACWPGRRAIRRTLINLDC
jgi:hypothetical protein